MTSTADIKLVWLTDVFHQSEIQEFTDKVLDYDLLLDSESQNRKIRVSKYVDFIIYRVSRSPKQYQLAGNRVYRYTVEVSYYVERQPDGSPRSKIERFFETLDEIIDSALDYNWGGNVTRMIPSEDVLEIDEVDLGGAVCLAGRTTYAAEKHFVE
jgi:hypothetical protein